MLTHFERNPHIKFRCFHETKQTQNEVERFFSNLTEFVLEYYHDSRSVLTPFAKEEQRVFLICIRFGWRLLTRFKVPNHVVEFLVYLTHIQP